MVDYRTKLIVRPGQKFALKDVDPPSRVTMRRQNEAAPELERYRQKLIQLQGLALCGEKARHSDRSPGHGRGGKDGTIKHVLRCRSIRKGRR